MLPHTASRLKERRDNSVKDYVNLAGPLKVTHLVMLSQSAMSVNLKIGRMPNGPTLSFKVRAVANCGCCVGSHRPLRHFQIESYTLMKNVRALQKRPMDATVH